MARRDDILSAVYAADRLHQQFDSKTRAARGEGRIDVFGMLVSLDIPLIFRPLKNLLGAFIDVPDRGVIVTTQRPLTVQRFTVAHELGHGALGHEASFDGEDILARALFVTERNYDRREIQANAFASQLLTPSWLIAHHMNRQGWTRESLTDPTVVYQLSLRMGSSYSATCYALADIGALDKQSRSKLLSVEPKAIKQELVKTYEPQNWFGDVWLVTNHDNGMVLEGSRSDLVVLRFEEHASSGYLWQFGDLASARLAIREDGRTAAASSQHVGGVVFRTVVAEAQGEEGASGRLRLRESRPWQRDGEPLGTLELSINFTGPVRAGLIAQQREVLLGVA